MKALGYIFLAAILIAGGVVLVKTGVFDAAINWITSWGAH